MQRGKNNGGNGTKGTTSRIALDQVTEVFASGGRRADALRADGMSALVDVKRAKLVQTRRERARVAERRGERSEQVAAIDRKMALEHRFLVGSRAERDRIAAPVLKHEPGSWQVHGHLRDQDGFPRAGYTVAVFTDREGRMPPLASTTTSSNGYFHMRWIPPAGKADSRTAKASDRDPLERLRRARLAVQALQGKPVYLGSRGPGQPAPAMDSRALYPLPGTIAYRDITIFDETDTGERCRFATRLLGNSATHKLHNVENEQHGCRLAAIRPNHRVYFESEAQAQRLGYDLCTFCFGRNHSRK